MTISNATENSILNLIFSAQAWANVADNAAGSPLTNIHVGLHDGDPGEGGTMSTAECTYSGYGRVNVLRTTGGWSNSTAGSISPVSNIDFPASAGSQASPVSFFSTGKTGGGAAAIFWSGAVSPTIAIGGPGITPRLTPATTITLDSAWLVTAAVVWFLSLEMGIMSWLMATP